MERLGLLVIGDRAIEGAALAEATETTLDYSLPKGRVATAGRVPMSPTRLKVLGVLGLLIVVCLLTGIFSDSFFGAYNLENLLRRSSMYGILSIGAAFVIIGGGMDLSIGSVVALVGCLLPWLVTVKGFGVPSAVAIALTVSLAIGLFHGLLITFGKLQPFIVTLCGLLLYRGLARGFTSDQPVGFGTSHEALRTLAVGRLKLGDAASFAIPAPFFFLLAVAILAGVFFGLTVWGRYVMAIGRNEIAARYSGIRTRPLIILTYVVSALLAGLGGLLFVLDDNTAQPSLLGTFYELWAIAAAVLGGCSLRGGEGSIIGVVIGAVLLQVLRNAITLVGIPSRVDFAVVGVVILAGAVADEGVRRFAARRRAIRA